MLDYAPIVWPWYAYLRLVDLTKKRFPTNSMIFSFLRANLFKKLLEPEKLYSFWFLKSHRILKYEITHKSK